MIPPDIGTTGCVAIEDNDIVSQYAKTNGVHIVIIGKGSTSATKTMELITDKIAIEGDTYIDITDVKVIELDPADPVACDEIYKAIEVKIPGIEKVPEPLTDKQREGWIGYQSAYATQMASSTPLCRSPPIK